MSAPLQYEDAISQLKAVGFRYADYIAPEGSGRMPAMGKPANNQSAWYAWSDNHEVLNYDDHANGIRGTIFPSNENRLSNAEASRLYKLSKERQQEAQAARERKQEQAAHFARNTWKNAKSEGTHPYIERKALAGLHNTRVSDAGALLIPMWVYGVGLVNVQKIQPDGTKRFLKGGCVKGAYSVIGSLDNADGILLTEGWATGATLHEQQFLPVVVAFSAGNLLAVAQVLKSRFPEAQVVVCADDDRQTTGNPGRHKAIEAAEKIGALVAMPELCKACRCTDFNDAQLCNRSRAHG